MLITITIDVSENKYVAIVDVTGAFLTADMDKEVIIVLEGEFAKIMEEIYPSTYREYVSLVKNIRKVLYVQLQNVLYQCIHSNIIFYRKLKGEIEVFGFLINQYYTCVANKWVNGIQMTDDTSPQMIWTIYLLSN